jgi:hypothetical protein
MKPVKIIIISVLISCLIVFGALVSALYYKVGSWDMMFYQVTDTAPDAQEELAEGDAFTPLIANLMNLASGRLAVTAADLIAIDTSWIPDGYRTQLWCKTDMGDGGGGTFYFIEDDTTATDGGVYYQATDAGGAWKRDNIKNNQFELSWFTNPDDANGDSSALQAAIDVAASVGSTNDSPAVAYRNSVVHIGLGKWIIDDQITLRPGVSLSGPVPIVPYNISGLKDTAFGATMWITETTTPVFNYDGETRLRGSNITIENLVFTQGTTLRQAGEYSGDLFNLDYAFFLRFDSCAFIDLGYSTVIDANSSNGVSVLNSAFAYIGDASYTSPSGNYTHGTALDFTGCADSIIHNVFIEHCGDTGAILGTNNKLSQSFIDFCDYGVKVVNDRVQIVNTSIKWHQWDGVNVVDGDDLIIDNCRITYNNLVNGVTAATAGFGIHFETTASENIIISDTNMVDDCDDESRSVCSGGYKTAQQGGIYFEIDGCTGDLTNLKFFPADTSFNTTMEDHYPFLDVNGQFASGYLRATNIYLEGTDASYQIHFPWAPTAVSTFGDMNYRIPYRDRNGDVLGQIPLFNSLADDDLDLDLGDGDLTTLGTVDLTGATVTLPDTLYADLANYDSGTYSWVSDGTVIYVAGRAAVGDGGGGLFKYVEGDTTSDNGATVIEAGDDAWQRIYDAGSIKPIWWTGINANGTSDDASVLQDVIEFAEALIGSGAYNQTGVGIDFEGYRYLVSTGLVVQNSTNGLKLYSSSRKGATLETTTDDLVLLTIGATGDLAYWNEISNINFVARGDALDSDTGTAIKLDNAYRTNIKDCIFQYWGIGIDSIRSNTTSLIDCDFLGMGTRSSTATAWVRLVGDSNGTGGTWVIQNCKFQGHDDGYYPYGLLVQEVDTIDVTDSYFGKFATAAVATLPDGTEGKNKITEVHLGPNLYFDDPVSGCKNVYIAGEVTSGGYYQNIRLDSNYNRGNDLAVNNVKVMVSDGDTFTAGTWTEGLTNGNFTAWTGDDPDSWTVANEDASNDATEIAGTLNMTSDNSAELQVSQEAFAAATVGSEYRFKFDIDTITSGAVRVGIEINGAVEYFNITTTGTHTYYRKATTTDLVKIRFYRWPGGASDFVIDDASVGEQLVRRRSLENISLTGGEMKGATGRAVWVIGSDTGYIEPENFTIEGVKFIDGNVGGSAGQVIQAEAGSFRLSNNTFGKNRYETGDIIQATLTADDNGCPVFIANDNDMSSANITDEPFSFSTIQGAVVEITNNTLPKATDNGNDSQRISQTYKLFTANADYTTIFTKTPPLNTAGFIKATIVGVSDDGTEYSSSTVSARYYRGGSGNPVLSADSPTSEYYAASDGFVSPPKIAVSSATIVVQVAGVSYTNVIWSAVVEQLTVAHIGGVGGSINGTFEDTATRTPVGTLDLSDLDELVLTEDATGNLDTTGTIGGRAINGTLAAEGSLTAAQMHQAVYTISGAYDQTFPDCGAATDGCSAMFILETDDEIEFVPATETDVMLHYGDVTCTAGYGITTEAAAVGEVYTAVCYGSKGNGTWVWVTASDMAEGADAFP